MLVSWRETAAAANLFYPCRAWPSVFLLPRLMSESPFFREKSKSRDWFSVRDSTHPIFQTVPYP